MEGRELIMKAYYLEIYVRIALFDRTYQIEFVRFGEKFNVGSSTVHAVLKLYFISETQH